MLSRERLGLVCFAGGVQQDRGGRDQRTGGLVTGGNQVQGAAAQLGRRGRIARAERVGGVLEQADRHLVTRLRAPGGCPWDREQKLADIRAYLLEEAHETAAAIDAGDWSELAEELGDLLFQVAFIGRLAEEARQLAKALNATEIATE